MYFKTTTAPLGQADLLASGAVMSPGAPTGSTPSFTYASSAADGSSPRTIYDGTWLSTVDTELDNATVTATFWAASVDNPAFGSTWAFELWQQVGAVWTKFAAASATLAPSATPAKYEMTLTNVTTPKGKLVALIDPGSVTATADTANLVLYGSSSYPSGLKIVPKPVVTVEEGPSIVEETLESGASARLNVTTDNASSATYRYSWVSTTNGSMTARLTTAGSGNVSLAASDGSNTSVVSLTSSGDGAANQTIPAAAEGNWAIELVLTEFKGSITVTIEPEPIVVGSGDANQTATSSSGNVTGTANSASGTGGGAPGPGVLGALATVVAVVWRVRRRIAG